MVVQEPVGDFNFFKYNNTITIFHISQVRAGPFRQLKCRGAVTLSLPALTPHMTRLARSTHTSTLKG